MFVGIIYGDTFSIHDSGDQLSSYLCMFVGEVISHTLLHHRIGLVCINSLVYSLHFSARELSGTGEGVGLQQNNS